MTENTEKLYRQALSLSPAERAALVEELLNSLDATSAENDELWASEAEERLRAFKAGEIEAFSADEVFAELKRA